METEAPKQKNSARRSRSDKLSHVHIAITIIIAQVLRLPERRATSCIRCPAPSEHQPDLLTLDCIQIWRPRERSS